MYFKKIEIVGFKSFLNKTVLKMEPGVTAIVGPNGCGKSNIVDAIKWVLGEQSTKAMRSSSMQDVIFNGTDKFEPVNMAEVSITFDNTDRKLHVDYDEVTITRRLHRSGESDYLINKTPVRLMDVRDMIMGTGIGTSSYSVIEQGKMDLILSSKPEERRIVFEEASGITRYKAKKKEALQKLERTQDNLTRINDIVKEVERQIKGIERQARKADRYKAFFDECKDLDIKLNYKKVKALDSDEINMGSDSSTRKATTDGLSEDITMLTEELAQARKALNSTMEELHGEQEEIMRLSSDIDKNVHITRVNTDRVGELEKYIQRLDWEIEEAAQRKEKLKERVEFLNAKHAEISKKKSSKDEELGNIETRSRSILDDIRMYEHELSVDRSKTYNIVEEQTKLKNALIRLNSDVQNITARIKRLNFEKDTVQKETVKVQEQLSFLFVQMEEVKTDLEKRKKELDDFNVEFYGSQKKLDTLKNELMDKERRVHEIKPRMEFLQKIISEREGIKKSVKEIIKLKEAGRPEFQGVHGILSEIIKVRSGYEESLEACLGEYSQALIVETRTMAENVMGYLQSYSLSSASFIILDELQNKKSLNRMSNEELADLGVSNILEVVDTKEEYKSAFCAMLNNIYVCHQRDDTYNKMKVLSDFDGAIISLSGEVIGKGQYRSKNYSTEEVVSIFGRQEKLDELKKEEQILSCEINEKKKDALELQTWLKQAAVNKENLEISLREKQLEFADVSSKKSVVGEKADSLSTEVTVIVDEIKTEEAQLEEFKNEGKTLNIKLNELEQENNVVVEKMEQMQSKIKEHLRNRDEVVNIINDFRIELSALRKEEEHLLEALTREKDNLNNMGSDIENKKTMIDDTAAKINGLKNESSSLTETNESLRVLIEEKTQGISGKKEEKENLVSKIERTEISLRQKESSLEKLRDEARDLDIKRKEIEYKIENIKQKIQDSYKVDILNVAVEIEEGFDSGHAEERVLELKSKMENMGEVSLGASMELEQLEKRFLFLTTQRDDLVRGREDILKAIQKINKTTKAMFMESFDSIRAEFSTYFKMLFNGGKAELVLEDEHNILECGIDIVVRPPGKKLQNIMLLSGGEKAMTAIALIFAIFKVNPSPFCILDEIDAPLDESNVVRFSRVLGEFLKLSQFIIVTHNRMTIQLADVLYGVTMQDKGVSKIVSVKFADEEKVRADEEKARVYDEIPSAI
ncbi:MAG: chromosome segregation protein SMC [Candidatus Omnitrophica bacterium]|nr:chromosome segregation protein SMC [Candidatus Omnitrophota bacterium]